MHPLIIFNDTQTSVYGQESAYETASAFGCLLMVLLMSWDVLSAWFSTNLKWYSVFSPNTVHGKFFYSDLFGFFVWVLLYIKNSEAIIVGLIIVFILYLSIIGYRLYRYFLVDGWLFVASKSKAAEVK